MPRIRILSIPSTLLGGLQPWTTILEFLRQHTLAVIATSHADGKPEAAAIDFSVRDNLEIVFDTFEQTRKFENLSDRTSVALVVGWDKNITVQYEGDAMKVSAYEMQEYQKAHLESVPVEREFVENGAVLFKVVPRWMRYSDFTKDPVERLEVSF